EERRQILEQRSLLTSQDKGYFIYKAAMFRYRSLIESGDWSAVPLIAGWSLEPFQVQSPVAVYKRILQAMSANQFRNQDWEHDFEALSADRRKAEHEQEKVLSEPYPAVKELFGRLSEEGFGHVYDPDPETEEFVRIRNSKKLSPDLRVTAEDLKREFG